MQHRSVLASLATFSSLASATLYSGPPSPGARFDYIVVGGGTGGLVIANRLSADPNTTVAVLEAGADQRNNPNVTEVATFGAALGTQVDWQYKSEPQEFAGNASGPGKVLTYDSGKALGGTSCINGMTYIRSAKPQLDAWASAYGNPGWNWTSMFACYLKSETFQVPTPLQASEGAQYEPAVNGMAGPLDVGWMTGIAPQSTYEDARDAWNSVGYPTVQDLNNGNPSNFGDWPLTLNRKLNIRWDAAHAYLWPVINRTNLHVFQNTLASKITWESGCGEAVASGVVVAGKDGGDVTVLADKEVVVALGSIKSPALLEMSGVGNPVVLDKFNIPVKVDLPSVGENLQDQPNFSAAYEAGAGRNFTGYPTYVTYPNASDLFGANTTAMESYVRANIPSYAKAIVGNTTANGTTQAIQEKLLTVFADLLFQTATPAAEILTAPVSVVVMPMWPLLPFSRGSVHITGANSSSSGQPAINPNFYMIDFDGILQTAAARLVRRFAAAGQKAGWIGAEVSPGPSVPQNATDAQWVAALKQGYGPNYHPTGTCAMLAKDLGGVVDAQLKVYGTSNVRIVDASVLPSQTIGHLTSTIYALAERAAALMMGLDGC